MKTILLFICGLFFSTNSFGQGSILGFTIEPQYPTEADFVKVKVGLSFTSGDCPLADMDHNTNGLITEAHSHHCLGMLTVICNTIDTFNLGVLPVGVHKFRLVLSSGAAPIPCTPGVIADDVDSATFSVGRVLDVNNYSGSEHNVLVYPNPMGSEAKVLINSGMVIGNAEFQLMDIFGKIVLNHQNIRSGELILSKNNLDSGLYFYRLIKGTAVLARGKIIIE